MSVDETLLPLGVPPRTIMEHHRIVDLLGALTRYVEAGECSDVMSLWLDELNDLMARRLKK